MWITSDNLKRAEQRLEPVIQTTATGVRMRFDRTNTASDGPAKSIVQVAWRAYDPPRPRSGAPTVLFIPGEPFSGAIYHEVALLLAEQGVPAAALSLGWQGYGRWASIDLGSLDDITVEQCLHRYVAPVHLELRQPDSALVLAGDGLGGILAQCFAQRHPDLAGIALLGSCTPHRASQVWRSGLSWQGTHRAPEADAYLSVEEVRATYLHNAASADQAFLLWQKMRQVRPARLSQDYGRLTRQSFITPAVPVMLIAGQQDHLIPPGVLEATAADYGVQPHVLDGAPYLVAWTHASTVAELLFQAITNTLSVKQ